MSAAARRAPGLALAAAAASLVCAALFALHARAYLPFIADDALISLRYAERFANGQGLTWNDGERVEGYSNLLWVLATAGGGLLLGDPIRAARALGTASGALVFAALFAGFVRHGARGLAAAGFGAASLLLAGAFAVWAVGGLEQPLLALLLAAALASAYAWLGAGEPRAGQLLCTGAALAFACLARPDGVIFAAAGAAALVLVPGAVPGGRRWRAAAWLAALPAAAVAGQLAFRLVYYGDFVPNTAHAKLGFSAARLREGAEYLWAAVNAMPTLVLALGLLAPLAASPRRAHALFAGAMLVAWLAYVAAIGGDILPAHRHLVPALALAAFLLAEGALWALARFDTPRGRAATGAACILALGTLVQGQWRDAALERARGERWEWEGLAVGEVLRAAFGARAPLLAVDAAGCLPYFSKLPALDMLGLNDAFLARHPPADLGAGYLGHELGDGAYVLRRAPDLVIFCGPLGAEAPCFRSGRELVALPEFAREYTLARLAPAPPVAEPALVWVRRSGRAGLTPRGDALELPALLFAARAPALARLAGAALVVDVAPGRAVTYGPVALEPGLWSVEALAEPPAQAVLTDAAGAPLPTLPDGRAVVAPGARVAVAVSAPGESGGTALSGVRLRRGSEAR